MNRNRLLGCVVAALAGLTLSACGADAPEVSSSQAAALQEEKVSTGSALLCDYPVGGPVDLNAFAPLLEIDRTYLSARPGFNRTWLPVGVAPAGTLFGQVVSLFDTPVGAQDFSNWLDTDFTLGGTTFWNRPDFALGHECHVSEVIGSLERPTTKASQVTIRTERFHVASADSRGLLRAWFATLKAEATARGVTALWLLYSEPEQTATVLYFADVPEAQRSLMTLAPIAMGQPFVAGSDSDRSGWVITVWFPFLLGDRGQASVWPIPDIHPSEGDGVCEVSRHESYHTTTDCLATCGNGVQDPGESWANCPGDVRIY